MTCALLRTCFRSYNAIDRWLLGDRSVDILKELGDDFKKTFDAVRFNRSILIDASAFVVSVEVSMGSRTGIRCADRRIFESKLVALRCNMEASGCGVLVPASHAACGG